MLAFVFLIGLVPGLFVHSIEQAIQQVLSR